MINVGVVRRYQLHQVKKLSIELDIHVFYMWRVTLIMILAMRGVVSLAHR